jgi:hypothetical protein
VRLLAWIARKARDALIDTMVLLMFRLREAPYAILPSEKITEIQKQAHVVCIVSEKLE